MHLLPSLFPVTLSRSRDGLWHKSAQKDIDGQQTERLWQMTCPEQTPRGDFGPAGTGAAPLKAAWTSDPIEPPSPALPPAESRKHSLILFRSQISGLSLGTARLKPWELKALSNWSPKSPIPAGQSPPGIWHDGHQHFQGYGCSAHINTTSNL